MKPTVRPAQSSGSGGAAGVSLRGSPPGPGASALPRSPPWAVSYRMVIALDVGTSSARAACYDDTGRAVAGRFHRVAYAPAVTPDGGVEHDALRLFEAAVECVDHVLAGVHPGEVRAVGVTTFWHGLLGFDAHGRPATPVYTWADTRSAEDARLLHDALDEAALHARPGCPLPG